VLAGWETVDTAVGHAALRRYLERLLHDEIAPTLPATPGLDLRAYGARLLERFANPALQHRTRQIAMDGSQKIPQRWLGTVRDRLAAGAGIERLALAVAAWLQTLGGVDEAGRTLAVDDPLADALARCADAAPGAVQRVEALCSFAPVFGELGADPRFVGAVLQQAQRLRAEGVVGALASAV
jgi:fructuronate reductase